MTALLTLTAMLALSQAPIPEQLMTARTVYLANVGTQQKALDTLANELKKWGRFTLVAKRDAADVVVELGESGSGTTLAMPVVGGGVMAIDAGSFVIVVRDRASREVLWSDRDAVMWTNGSSLKALAKRLRERLEPKK